MRKVMIPISVVLVLMVASLVGCDNSGSASPAPADVQLGPQPPEQPAGAADAMKNSIKMKGGKLARRGQSGQVPH
jgi:hypothetical protein